jgi:enamine deaminase RidA (YjgF/YER057c/UK114 family)
MSLTFQPRPTGSIRESLRALRAAEGDVLSLVLFVEPGHAACRDRILAEVADLFDGDPPPTAVVAQAPDTAGGFALEAAVRAPGGAAIVRRAVDGIRYTVVEGHGFREVHCTGIPSDPALKDSAARSRDAFTRMEAVLRREGLGFGHVVRQWAYLEGILDIHPDCPEGHQGYQAFNDMRALAYARSTFPAGYPAATGIGQATGGVVLDFVALDAPGATVLPLSNPRQTDAHRYSEALLVGESNGAAPAKCTPRFERAKRIVLGGEETTLVSGTAAIVGEESVAKGDVAAQTRTTIDNIAALVGAHRLSRLRAYVKRKGDIATVRRICAEAFGPVPAVYVQADVCREELLVEIEGALVTRKEG